MVQSWFSLEVNVGSVVSALCVLIVVKCIMLGVCDRACSCEASVLVQLWFRDGVDLSGTVGVL